MSQEEKSGEAKQVKVSATTWVRFLGSWEGEAEIFNLSFDFYSFFVEHVHTPQ